MPSTSLLESLRGIRRKVKALGVLHGVGLVGAALVAVLLGVVVLDYAMNLPGWPRLIVMVAGVGAIGAVGYRALVRPMMARLTLRDVAARLEKAFPEFEDRLRSTVDFAGEGVPGSEVMKERTIAEAQAIAGRVDLSKAIAYRPTMEALGAAGVAILFVAMLWAGMPNYARIAMARLGHPFEANPWPKRVEIDLAGRMPVRVPVGERIEVKVRLVKGDSTSRRAVVYSQYGDGAVEQEVMTRGADGTYAASLDARPEAGVGGEMLKVWVRAGDDEKQIAPITVVPRLAIARVEAVITPPAYAGQEALTTSLTSGPAMTVAGAQVELRVAFNKDLATAGGALRIEPAEADEPGGKRPRAPQVQWVMKKPALAVGRWGAESSLRFHIRATDADGFENTGLEEYELIVRPDQTPTVQIEIPRKNEERTAEATVPLQAVAEDDFGIQSARLVVDRLAVSSEIAKPHAGAERPRHWEIPLIEGGKPDAGIQWARADSTPDRLRYRLNYDWQLAQLQNAELKSGDVLEYHVEVTDNYSLNGQTHAAVPSGKLRISILSQEEFASRITDELRLAAQQVAEMKKAQARTKEETATLKEDTKNKAKLDAGDQAVAERLVNQQSTVASQSQQIAGKMQDIQGRMDENKSPNQELKQTAKDVQEILSRAAENPMKDALAKLSQSQMQEAQAQRNQDLDQAQASQEQSAEELQKALDRMGSVGNLQQVMDRIKDLLARQQEVSKQTQEIAKNNLGKKPEEMGDEDRKKLEKNAQDQQRLSEQTGKALTDMQKLAEQLKKSDEPTSSAMKQAAETGQQQQVPQKQAKAAQSAQQNQQSSAQANQKQAELGLEMMLNDLREAERRKLEELARKLEELQQQVAHLIKRQATHSLDDLALQGGDRVSRIDPKVLADLTMKADRAKDEQPSPLPQLTAGQEQTERNTRDIGKTTEDMPNGAEPAAILTKAASKMERAIVFLRDGKLDPAFDPWQTEALRALVDAKNVIDEQKRQVDEKRQKQQKDAIRVAYEKIKAEQILLNGETVRLDGAPKNPDGTLSRADSVRLGQLPGQQGTLADRIKGLDDDLSALGSVVYTWANKDIAGAMGQVKGDLAKPDTGKPTQVEQVRVVAQLDAMIRNLAIKPLEKKFDQRESGGGGGGSGAPPLPPEAELRLLRALQDGVNTGTKELAGQANKDKSAVAGLGNRQGELRNLLDQVFQKSSQGKVKLGPEPDNRDQLPEEAKKEAVENQEIDKQLLGDSPTADDQQKGVSLIGDRMARSRQRLAINNDAGAVTQEIQRRINADLDTLIESARKQQSQGGQGKGQPQQVVQKQEKPDLGKQSKPSNGKSQENHGQTPAQASTPPGAADNTADLSQDIKEKMTEWGGITQRQREAIIEGAGETVIQKYQKLIDDYSRALATKATETRQ